ncbi:MAG TPA: hypothetical protein VFP17_06725 [Solirubrobacterales bacterium]|nr:hypothetical protein [Solirubrobacterales bacterium]
MHVHTPRSVLNNGFGDDFDAYARTFFQRAIEREIAVVGVTDYFLIRGYRELRELQADESRLVDLLGKEQAAQAAEILLLPNIELRLNELIKVGSPEPRVALHVIFGEDVDPAEIENNFLHQLHYLSEADPDDLDERPALTVPNLEASGRRLKEQHERFRGQTDLKAGMEQAVVSHDEITKVLRGKRHFRKRHLLILAADEHLSKVDWDGPGHITRKVPVQKACFFPPTL